MNTKKGMAQFAPYNPNYILLDAARMLSDMDKAQDMNPDYVSLYKGGIEQHLSSVAPYLFQLGKHSQFDSWIAENKGNSWGIYVQCKADMSDMAYHFRRFLKVKTEDMQQLYFRFYDPRVLRLFLPTCEPKQLVEFFGPIEYFICEQDDKEIMKVYSQQQGALLIQEIKLPKISITEKKNPHPEIILQATTHLTEKNIELDADNTTSNIKSKRKWL